MTRRVCLGDIVIVTSDAGGKPAPAIVTAVSRDRSTVNVAVFEDLSPVSLWASIPHGPAPAEALKRMVWWWPYEVRTP